MNPLVPLPVLVPLAAAILLALVNKRCARWLADSIAIAATVTAGTISVLLLRASTVAPIIYWYGGWTPRAGVAVGVNFYVDPFSAGLAAFVCLLGLAAFLFSLHYFDSVGTLFHVLMLGFVGAMCGFSLSGDLFNLFVFFELMSVAAYSLCGYKTEEPSTQQGAINFAVLNTIGGFLALIGLGMFYSRTGALNMAQIGRALSTQSDVLVTTAFVFVISGFLVKAAAFPFHFWLADAHAVAPTPACVLFSGIMVQLGVYAVARVYWATMDGPFGAHRPAVTAVLLTVGVLTALLGALMCFAQTHIKRLLAFSTISHTGILLIGISLLRPDALAGAALYVIGHGAAKGALFLVAGILLHRFGSIEEARLYGRARHMRCTGAVFALGGLALAALAPFGTFVGEHAIDSGAEHAGMWWLRVIFFLAGSITAAAVLRVYARVFLGRGTRLPVSDGSGSSDEGRETKGSHSRVPAVMFGPCLALLLIALGAGCIPGAPHACRTAATAFADHAGYQARVLDGAWLPIKRVTPEPSAMATAVVSSIVRTAFAVVLAVVALFWGRRASQSAAYKVITMIRGLHSGKVGDYVAYFAFGVAAIAAALALLISG